MDIDKISRTYPTLVAYMKSINMGHVACGAIEPMVRKLVEHKGDYTSYPDFFEKFIDKEGIYGNTKRLAYYRTTIRHIWGFDEYNRYPDRLLFPPTSYSNAPYFQLNKFYKSIIDDYISMAEKRMLTKKTINVDKNVASAFFATMQQSGATDINMISPESVVGYFIKDGEYIRGNDMASKLKKVLKCFVDKYPYIEDIMKLIPMRRDVVNLQDQISDEEIKVAKKAINDATVDMLLRDRAIIAIALYTGMRGCDIANLNVDNVDWANDRITLIQSKTQQRLTLPLVGSVGNALYDYIVKEWPKELKSKRLFYNQHNKSVDISAQIIGSTIERFFTKLGFKTKGKQRRVRILRHYLASKLLSVGAEPAVISSILGHAKPETINHYLDMDIENLRKCALDVSMYPLSKELLK